MGARYLYTFEAKEIQKFILQSDKLKEMIGGSEIVARLCDDFLKKSLQEMGIADGQCEIIANAAGWARLVFHEQKQMEMFFAYWPLLAGQFAPGLQVIQGVTPFGEKGELPAALDRVNEQLRRERNFMMRALPEITPLIERTPRTGLAATRMTEASREPDKQAKILDRQADRKRAYSDETLATTSKISVGEKQSWPTEFEEIVVDDNAYLAIIHADGNDLGSTLIQIKKHVQKPGVNAAEVYKKFSQVIEKATVKAVQHAFDAVLRDAADERKDKPGVIPARPIVLGGDDLTIIVRADLAFNFTTHFLREFEEQSTTLLEEELKGIDGLPKRLTACAGVAFVKKAHPFIHGYELAESLCSYTKLQAKGKKYRLPADMSTTDYIPSSFAFHRVTSSIAGDYGEIRRKELSSPGARVKLWFGPYAVCGATGGLPTFQNLQYLSKALRSLAGGSVRELITDLYLDQYIAKARYERMLQVAGDIEKSRLVAALEALIPGGQPPFLSREGHTPLLDALTVQRLQNLTEEETDDQG